MDVQRAGIPQNPNLNAPQAEHDMVERANVKHRSSRTFVEGKEEIKHLYDVGRSLQSEYNPTMKHDTFYQFKTVRATVLQT